jgi:hypothetical protein
LTRYRWGLNIQEYSTNQYLNNNNVWLKIRSSQGDALVVAIPSTSYGILEMVKLGIKRWKAKLWLKLWLIIPQIILLTRFNINFFTIKEL